LNAGRNPAVTRIGWVSGAAQPAAAQLWKLPQDPVGKVGEGAFSWLFELDFECANKSRIGIHVKAARSLASCDIIGRMHITLSTAVNYDNGNRAHESRRRRPRGERHE